MHTRNGHMEKEKQTSKRENFWGVCVHTNSQILFYKKDVHGITKSVNYCTRLISRIH